MEPAKEKKIVFSLVSGACPYCGHEYEDEDITQTDITQTDMNHIKKMIRIHIKKMIRIHIKCKNCNVHIYSKKK